MKGSRARFSKAVIFTAALAGSLMAVAHSARAELVGHWTLDNETAGLVNMGTNGSPSNLSVGPSPPTFNATGGFDGGGYVHFEGNGLAVTQALIANTAGNAAAALTGYPFTFTGWVRGTSSLTAGRGTILAFTNTTINSQYFAMAMGYSDLAPNFNDLEGIRRNTAFQAQEAVGSRNFLYDGNWHFVAAVYASDNSISMYAYNADRTLGVTSTGTTTVAYPAVGSTNAIYIGGNRRLSGNIDSYKGDIDDVRFYNTALTAEEIDRIVTPHIPGDFDDDRDVDGADFVAWQTNLGLTSGATLAQGDADGDTDVDGADFDAWQTHFPHSPSPSTSPIPEPASLVLTMFAVFGIGLASRRYAREARMSGPPI